MRRGGLQEVAHSGKEIDSTLRTALINRIGQERFDVWFQGYTQICQSDGGLLVRVTNKFRRDLIQRVFQADLAAAALEVLGESKFHCCIGSIGVGASPPGQGGNAGQASPKSAPAPAAIGRAESPRRSHNGNLPSSPSSPATSGREPVPTLTLAQPHVERPRPRFATLDTFVVGERESARLALESARAALEEPGSMSPLLIYGPTGVGKTHLLEGIWSAAQRNRGLGTALFLTAEQFTTQFVSALRGTGLPNFRRKYRGVGLLIIDDIQFFAGKQSTLTELLHTLNKLMHEGRQIVLSADRTPAELGDLGRDLVNRLQSGMVCRLEPLDYAARLGMVEQLCLKHNMEVSPKVQQFIAASLVGHSRELTGALNRLRVTSRARREPITLELAQSALAEMIRYSTPVVRLPDIERAVCDVFGIERDSLHSNRRAKAVAYPRMLAMWLARKHTRAALSEIGHYFGRRSHTTVLSAQKKVEGWMSTSAHLALADRNWSIEEAVWSIEAQLHAS